MNEHFLIRSSADVVDISEGVTRGEDLPSDQSYDVETGGTPDDDQLVGGGEKAHPGDVSVLVPRHVGWVDEGDLRVAPPDGLPQDDCLLDPPVNICHPESVIMSHHNKLYSSFTNICLKAH